MLVWDHTRCNLLLWSRQLPGSTHTKEADPIALGHSESRQEFLTGVTHSCTLDKVANPASEGTKKRQRLYPGFHREKAETN